MFKTEYSDRWEWAEKYTKVNKSLASKHTEGLEEEGVINNTVKTPEVLFWPIYWHKWQFGEKVLKKLEKYSRVAILYKMVLKDSPLMHPKMEPRDKISSCMIELTFPPWLCPAFGEGYSWQRYNGFILSVFSWKREFLSWKRKF